VPVPVPVPVPAPTLADRAAQQPTAEKVTLDTDTYFDFDRATLKPEGRQKLDELVSRIASMQLEVVIATGHTDRTGTDSYNQKLSERRALRVKSYLVEKGLPADRIFTDGKGERQPVASNATREGRARNRRVDVELVGTRR
jgi:OOP family OmpA-OmpF porin